ncbi:dipicolinate synthase subunit B [Neomoorella thermoacetica]|uniref:Dipicolinate synthase subunit B n=3 Tax=Neomoorella thermoacetica TaxID=1525 RepID=A0A1D7XA48_NEOTH|nr:dipicolinate synthase subunit B [Moorella thermoacetica]AKX93827.1 dipicolinate synthase subunit B [Moorella thermoacetica]AKX96469.1 dipicolinate synthase subunit B [Moorella thermoacetica]AOQ23746.1 Dipicolinate synthase subunit B [Moorella thermoacetica]APC08205.1 dipicolinate synthase subunit B [Moorella thermoacetica]OIQ08845.1 dipicolinate synthase subunit B [Moorella thermoacetica]
MLQGKKVGFAVTGSHCTLAAVMPELARVIAEGAEVVPIISPAVRDSDTRYGTSSYWRAEVERITGHKAIDTIVAAEPIGPQKLFDILVIAPCTGNTLAKLANGITDTPVLMAAKAQLRNLRPVVLAIASNDGLGANAVNLGRIMNTKNIYLVPFGQDDPEKKPNSLVARMDLLVATIVAALEGRQIQPVLMGSPEKGQVTGG